MPSKRLLPECIHKTDCSALMWKVVTCTFLPAAHQSEAHVARLRRMLHRWKGARSKKTAYNSLWLILNWLKTRRKISRSASSWALPQSRARACQSAAPPGVPSGLQTLLQASVRNSGDMFREAEVHFVVEPANPRVLDKLATQKPGNERWHIYMGAQRPSIFLGGGGNPSLLGTRRHRRHPRGKTEDKLNFCCPALLP